MEGAEQWHRAQQRPCHPTHTARACWSPADLVEGELLLQVEVGAFAAQVLLHQLLHALLLQAVGHIVEGVLVWEGCQRLGRITGMLLALGCPTPSPSSVAPRGHPHRPC